MIIFLAEPLLTSSHSNLTVLMVLNGEPGWVCLMCCNSDSKCPPVMDKILSDLIDIVLFSAVVIQWVTSRDSAGSSSQPTSAAIPESHQLVGRRPSMALNAINPVNRHSAPAGTDAENSLVTPGTTCPWPGNDHGFNTKSSKGPERGVVVTTTIHRQSRPTSGFKFDMTKSNSTDNEGGSTDGSDTMYRDPSAASSHDISHADVVDPPWTYISGGRRQPQPRSDA